MANPKALSAFHYGTVPRDQTWNRFWNRLSPNSLHNRHLAPTKSLKTRARPSPKPAVNRRGFEPA